MILTPLPDDALTDALATVARALADDPTAAAAFGRIAATRALIAQGVDLPAHRAAAVALARRLGMATIDEEPAAAYSWDGTAVRVRSEAWVLLHEIAHWQLCPPERRGLPDFGLGAGPETGRAAEADAAACVDVAVKEREEQLSSLLGILWEAELGQPALLAFLEQNWLEGWQRPTCAAFFREAVADLVALGHLDGEGRPAARHVPADRAA